MKNVVRNMAVCGLAVSVAAGRAAETDTRGEHAILENAVVRIEVSPVGARIVSLFDKVRGVESAKNFPFMGGLNEVRFGSLSLNDQRDPYVLAAKSLADGTRVVTASARTVSKDDPLSVVRVVKEYALAPSGSLLRVSLSLSNDGAKEVALIPWVRHLLLNGGDELPQESFMSPQGAYLNGRPYPWLRGRVGQSNAHFFPADGWTARMTLPSKESGNTVATLLRPDDMLKIYNWSKRTEDFGTQEVIARPLFVPPGETRRWDYGILVAAPVRNVVYAGADLVLGVTPHPTWLEAGTREVVLELAATRPLSGLRLNARLEAVGATGGKLAEWSADIPALVTGRSVRVTIPVNLEAGACHRLHLDFTCDGKPYYPGGTLDDQAGVVIPLITGAQETVPSVFAGKTRGVEGLRRIVPRERAARQALAADALEAFILSPAVRCFRPDTFQANGQGPVQLWACAGEYESTQLALVSKTTKPVEYAVTATNLKGPDGGEVVCESPREFIYVPTKMPSLYNALFLIGDYPEALLPTKRVTLTPGANLPLFFTWRIPPGTPPGLYRGTIRLAAPEAVHEIPVEMTVWNIELPLRSPGMDVASSLKGNTLAEALHADGTPYSRQEQLDAIVDMHLKYRLTPCDSGLAGLLLAGKFEDFDREMTRFIAAGATKIFLGQVPALLKQHRAALPEVERHLTEKGWQDYFYVRPGFDEASPDLVPQIAAVCKEWKAISRIPLMETYYQNERADELFGLLDIWSRNFPLPAWAQKRREAGDRFWKVNAMPGTLEDEPWTTGRVRYVGLWDHRMTGTYIWTVKAWSGVAKWGEDYWCDGGVGNLSAVLMWPHETGILSTIRLEAMRDGLEDNAMLWMLRAKVESLKDQTPDVPERAAALKEARELCEGGALAPSLQSVEDLERLHRRVGAALSALK